MEREQYETSAHTPIVSKGDNGEKTGYTKGRHTFFSAVLILYKTRKSERVFITRGAEMFQEWF